MKRANTSVVVIINGDNNQVSLGETKSHLSAKIIIAIISVIIMVAAVLAISYFCPELLAVIVRQLISIAITG